MAGSVGIEPDRSFDAGEHKNVSLESKFSLKCGGALTQCTHRNSMFLEARPQWQLVLFQSIGCYANPILSAARTTVQGVYPTVDFHANKVQPSSSTARLRPESFHQLSFCTSPHGIVLSAPKVANTQTGEYLTCRTLDTWINSDLLTPIVAGIVPPKLFSCMAIYVSCTNDAGESD